MGFEFDGGILLKLSLACFITGGLLDDDNDGRASVVAIDKSFLDPEFRELLLLLLLRE